MEIKSPPFESQIKTIEIQINQRRASWRLASIPWEDVAQMIMTRVFLKYHTFDPAKGEFSHWLSRLITHKMSSILRDNHSIYSRPCIQGCVFNTGGDGCSKTKSGTQCAECPIYKSWQIRKESHFNVKQTLPLENHEQEVNQKPSDFIDIEGSKKVIDREMKLKLNKHEYKMYRMLYIKNMSEPEVGKAMKYKKTTKMHEGYQIILAFRKKVVLIAKEIIDEQGLA